MIRDDIVCSYRRWKHTSAEIRDEEDKDTAKDEEHTLEQTQKVGKGDNPFGRSLGNIACKR